MDQDEGRLGDSLRNRRELSEDRVNGPVRKRPARRALLGLAGILVLGAVVAGGTLYWLDARQYESTDDAAIDGHVSQVAPQVAGRVIRLAVDDNQNVRAGQLLVVIDPRDYQARLNAAQAQEAQARAQLEQAQAQLGVEQANLAQAQAQIRVNEAALVQAQQDDRRYRSVNRAAITAQLLDNSSAALRSAQARLEAARQAAAASRAQIGTQQAQIDAARATLQNARAQTEQAALQLSYTQVVAPQDGRVTRRTVELGNYVSPGQALMAIVAPRLWVTANFKETQLTHMRVGQPVEVWVDAFPDAPLRAHVDSFQAGSGSVFSSLPAENATGNYVKVVQRVPVKIVFDDARAASLPFAPGFSVEPRVKVR